jgi:hypothetical protein
VNAAPTRLIRLSVSCVGLSVYQCCRNVFHGGLFLTLSVDRNDCRVHSVSVSIHLRSLRRICADQWYPVVIPLNRMYKLCICLENDCRVHSVSVSIHLRSLRRICADQWYPVVIPLNRMYKLCICLEKYFIVPLNRVEPNLCCRWYLGYWVSLWLVGLWVYFLLTVCSCAILLSGGLFLTLSVDRNDCRVHSVSVSIHLRSLRRICADQWYPVVIRLNRMYKLCIMPR